MVNTTHGLIDPDAPLVGPRKSLPIIETEFGFTFGVVETRRLDDGRLFSCTELLENRQEARVWAIEWHLLNHDSANCAICANQPVEASSEGRTLIKRSVWVNMKDPSVVADAIAASLG